MKDPKDNYSALDSFWDLSDLVPSARRPVKKAAFAQSVTPKTVEDNASHNSSAPSPPEGRRLPEDRRLSRFPAVSEVREYHPADNYLLETVRIHACEDPYPFYGRFCRDAARYFDVKGKECPYVPFFSYIPQYSQLKPEQLAYYLYFRDCANRGEYPRIDESYFYLYVYEIVNLSDRIPPEEGVLRLARAWAAYRGALPNIDKYMTEWLCDYCLVHGLSSPREVLRPFRAKILPHASLREFYLGEMGDVSLGGVDTALAFFSDYRFRDSRYAQGEAASAFEADILKSLVPVVRSVFTDREKMFMGAKPTTFRRDAFTGSLCAHQTRAHIEVVYYAVPDAVPLRTLLTNAVKYAENRIRIRMSVKSRLAVRELAPEYRRMIDEYFLDKSQGGASNGATAAKKKPIEFTVDPRAAAEIEANSWQTTRRLVIEEEMPSHLQTPQMSQPAPSAPLAQAQKTDKNSVADLVFASQDYGKNDRNNEADGKKKDMPVSPSARGLSHAATVYLLRLLQGDSVGARRVAAEYGRMEDELAEEINEKSMNEFGDIALEIGEDGYTLIPDYLDEVEQWMK